MLQTELLVLGGGPGGYVAAIQAAKAGMEVVLVEQDNLGGTCLNRGCIPTKALLKSAEIFDNIKESDTFGITASDPVVNFAKVQERKQGIVNQLVKGVNALCKKNKITVIKGKGAVLGPSIFSPVSGAVAVTFDDPEKEEEIIVPKKLIIATGSVPRTLPSLPLDEEYILSSDGMLEMQELPESIAIVGGGVIGCEFASILNSFGVDVTIIEFAERLLINESKAISKNFTKQMKRRGIKVMTQSEVTNATIKDNKVEVEIKGQEDKIIVDKVMVSVGRKPVCENIGLQNTSVKYDQKGIQVNEYYQTSESHIYAIGDCINTIQLAHVAMKEGEIAVKHMLEEPVETIEYQNVPRCTYTSPEIASVGYHKDNVPEGVNVKIGNFPFGGNGKALIEGDGSGFIEVVRDKDTDDLLGVSIIGPHATELIAEPSTAIYLNASPEEIGEVIHAHPTLSEAMMEANLDSFGKAVHK